MTQCYHNPSKNIALYVHAKCGCHTFGEQLKKYEVEHLDITAFDSLRCVFSIRSSLSRLVSAWRQLYLSTAMLLHNDKPTKRQLHDLVPSYSEAQFDLHLAAMPSLEQFMREPITLLNSWCESSAVDFLVANDEHFRTQSEAYQDDIDLANEYVLCNSISAICAYFGVRSKRLGVGNWPWTNIVLKDFNTPVVKELLGTYYAADQDLYDRSTATISQTDIVTKDK